MFKKQLDILSIGDTTTDAFIRLKEASVHCKVNTNDCEICMPFGDKIPFEYVKVVRAVGNAANAAVAGSRLGLQSALISNIGNDQNGRECKLELEKNKVSTTYLRVHANKPTNYHFVLWYEVDRTILVNHTEYDYVLPKFPAPKWIYLTSLGGNTYLYHMAIAEYLEANPQVKLAFQPGTFQIGLGVEKLKRIYARTEVFVVNVEEARKILNQDAKSAPESATFSCPAELAPEIKGLRQNEPMPRGFLSEPMISSRSNSPRSRESSDSFADPKADSKNDIKSLLKSLANLGPKIVLITDNTNGAYMFDGEHYYKIPMYPDPRPAFERTGCGDAFAATFVSALAMGKSPLEALTWAPVNPMSVAQFIGAQEGLLSLDQLDWWLKRAPEEYKVKEI